MSSSYSSRHHLVIIKRIPRRKKYRLKKYRDKQSLTWFEPRLECPRLVMSARMLWSLTAAAAAAACGSYLYLGAARERLV